MLSYIRSLTPWASVLIWAVAGSALCQDVEARARADSAASFAGVAIATTVCGDYGYEIDSDRLIEEHEQFVVRGVEAGRDREAIMAESRVEVEAEYANFLARQAKIRSATSSLQLRDAFQEDISFWRARCAHISQAYPLVLKADGDEEAAADRLLAGVLNAVSDID